MENIHVLHVLNSAHGGSALSTFELIETLKQRGVKSSLVCFNNASADQINSISKLVEGRVLFIPLYWMNKKIRAAWWKRPIIEAVSLWRTLGGYKHQRKISALIKQGGVNIVHTSTILNPEGAIAAKRNKLPHIWHVRELIGRGMYFQFPCMPLWVSFVKRNASLLVANSLVTKQQLSYYFEDAMLQSIPNGIDLNSFNVKTHHSTEEIIVGMIGNVTSRLKNHKFFIRTASLFTQNGIKWRIYGALPDQRDIYYLSLQKLIESSSPNLCIKFCSEKDSTEIISEIDILFHPTPFESFGRIFIEAMAGGIPVVAVNEGGALEMVRDRVNGYLIDPEDTRAASAAIRSLIDDPALRARFGANGRYLVEKEYSLDLLVSRVVLLYESVINRKVLSKKK